LSSKKSKNASAASPADGGETKPAAKAGAAASKRKSRRKNRTAYGFEIELVHARNSHLGWMIFGLVLGVLLLWKLAFVGKLIGVILLIVAGFAGRNFLLTVLNEPGTFRVEKDHIEMPEGLCRGRTVSIDYAQVKHAFFLRRAVPWTRAGPILVVEADDRALSYPRDWFSSDADQLRLLELLHTARKRAQAKAS